MWPREQHKALLQQKTHNTYVTIKNLHTKLESTNAGLKCIKILRQNILIFLQRAKRYSNRDQRMNCSYSNQENDTICNLKWTLFVQSYQIR